MPPSMDPSWVKTTHHDIYPAIDPQTNLANTASGKTILITGAGRGIGRAIAQAFALAGAARIVLTSRTQAQLDEVHAEIEKVSSSVAVQKVTCDVTDAASVKNLFASISGEIDVLVNNAGVLERCLPIGEADPEMWLRTWDVNVRGTFLPTHVFINRRTPAKGYIINTSSVGSVRTRPGFSAYQPSKTAINRITDFVDKEYPEIKAFAYHPGGVMTELARQRMPEETWSFLVDKPELAGGYCVWLTSGRADWLSGRYSSCNWDVGDLERMKGEILGRDLLKDLVEMEF